MIHSDVFVTGRGKTFYGLNQERHPVGAARQGIRLQQALGPESIRQVCIAVKRDAVGFQIDHAIEPQDICWVEYGGDSDRLGEWLGDHTLPVRCVDDATFERAWSEDPTPNGPADLPGFYDGTASSVDLVAECLDTNGDYLARLGSRNVARDLDRPAFELACGEADRPAPPGVSYLDSQLGLAIRRWCPPVCGRTGRSPGSPSTTSAPPPRRSPAPPARWSPDARGGL